MRHIHSVSKVGVSAAQMSSTEIITLVVSILSALAGILSTVIPLIGDKSS